MHSSPGPSPASEGPEGAPPWQGPPEPQDRAGGRKWRHTSGRFQATGQRALPGGLDQDSLKTAWG